MNQVPIRTLQHKLHTRAVTRNHAISSNLRRIFLTLQKSLFLLRRDGAMEKMTLPNKNARAWVRYRTDPRSRHAAAATNNVKTRAPDDQGVAQLSPAHRQQRYAQITEVRLKATNVFNCLILEEYVAGPGGSKPPLTLELSKYACDSSKHADYVAWLCAEIDAHERLAYAVRKHFTELKEERRREMVLLKLMGGSSSATRAENCRNDNPPHRPNSGP
ncbi:MAG: hypothetical protein LQ340_003023 [Diploschistes diacapsis]|nr:MAG: hypothetical protein LQ340_003023 [Diploschistes diacapsis]